MSEWPEQIPIDGAIPAGREAEDALRFLAQPGIWIHPERHPTNRADDVAVPPDHGTESIWTVVDPSSPWLMAR
jgi:hypothetical protein